MRRNGTCPVIELIPDTAPLDATEFERQLRAGGHSYHIYHPFNVLLNSGRASQKQIRAWVANRFYFQANIPVKDAAILANCDDRDVRREWVLRILDQDGHGNDPGEIESWVKPSECPRPSCGQCSMCFRVCALRWMRMSVSPGANPGRKRCVHR